MKLMTVEERCPAKINLTLQVLGRRGDGFHALHSVVAQTQFADTLRVSWDASATGPDRVNIEGAEGEIEQCSVLEAFRLVREATQVAHGRLSAELSKAIPVGAGLGGGSSDAVGALRALGRLWPEATARLDWAGLALAIGSDCPLFLRSEAVVMEGRGERIAPLAAPLQARLKGRPVILFKPPFAINTAEAYRRLAAAAVYSSEAGAVEALREWEDSGADLPPLRNDFMRLAEGWLPTFPTLLGQLRETFGWRTQLSGSGSACFAFPDADESDTKGAIEVIRAAWGEDFWLVRTALK
ncbi:MAG: hypothetical protein RL648_1724 [Verrucomicrobiota bacterium]